MHQVGISLETQQWSNILIVIEFNFTLLLHSVEGKKIMGRSCKPILHPWVHLFAYPASSCCVLIFLSQIHLIHTGFTAKLES